MWFYGTGSRLRYWTRRRLGEYMCHLFEWNAKDLSKCVRAFVNESKVFVTMVLVLIFAEVLGLYG